MAVLQHDPCSFLHTFLNHLQSDGALALTQGQGVKLPSSKALGETKGLKAPDPRGKGKIKEPVQRAFLS